MGVLIAYPQNKEAADALRAFMKALEIRFEEVESIYDSEFEKKIKRSKVISKRVSPNQSIPIIYSKTDCIFRSGVCVSDSSGYRPRG